MFKYILLLGALMAFAAAKPLVYEYPLAAAAYTSPLAYSAPLTYPGYSAYSPLAYSYTYGTPYNAAYYI